MHKQKNELKILITGAGGQVGRELIDACLHKSLPFIAYTSAQLDITNKTQLLDEIQLHNPTHIINAAAYTAVDKAESEPDLAYAINSEGVKYLSEAAKLVDAKLIHLSTDYVFDGRKKTAYTVNDLPNPESVYGASKLSGEQAIQSVFEDCPQQYFILRVSWIFGQYGNNFLKTMLRLAQSNKSISVVNDQYGAPTPASCIAECLISYAVLNEYSGIEHYESNPGVTWYEFAKQIFLQANIPINVHGISTSEYITPVRRPLNSKLSTQKVKLHCEWKGHLGDVINKLTQPEYT